jgi:hypothetical protein
VRGIKLTDRRALRGFLADVHGMAVAGEKLDREERRDRRRKRRQRREKSRRQRAEQYGAW